MTCAEVARHRRAATRSRATGRLRRCRSTPTLLRKRTNDNPVFYVQYAHAHTHNVARNAPSRGRRPPQVRPGLLTHETESALLGALQEFPRVVAFAAEVHEPHRVARYLEGSPACTTAGTTTARITPLGDDPIERAPHASVAERRHRTGAAQRPRPAGCFGARADVADYLSACAEGTRPGARG